MIKQFDDATVLRYAGARWLCGESQWRLKHGPFWNDLSIQQKDLWLSDWDSLKLSLEQAGIAVSLLNEIK
jgi:hypothetical protein